MFIGSVLFICNIKVLKSRETVPNTVFLKVSNHIQKHSQKYRSSFTLYLIETPFNAFANRADPDLFAYGNMIKYDPTLVDPTRNFFVLCTNMKSYLYSFHRGWSLA